MNYEVFAASMKDLVPDCKPEAASHWLSFAVENVEDGHFARLEATTDQNAAIENWLDTFYSGFLSVKENFNSETAAAIINLSCEGGCLYPGEMTQAALCLEMGGSTEKILEWIATSQIDYPDMFSAVPLREALQYMPAIEQTGKKSVLAQLKNRPKQENKKTAPKKCAER